MSLPPVQYRGWIQCHGNNWPWSLWRFVFIDLSLPSQQDVFVYLVFASTGLGSLWSNTIDMHIMSQLTLYDQEITP